MKYHPIECSEVRERLPLVPGHDLESPAREEVEAHLRTCASCSSELERLSHALAQLRLGSALEAPPVDLWSAVRAELVREQVIHDVPAGDGQVRAPRVPAPKAARRAPLALLGRGLVLAAALAASIAVIGFLWSRARPDQPRTKNVELVKDEPGTIERTRLNASPSADTASGGVLLAEGADSGELVLPNGLRRAAGEERLREVSMPFETTPARASAYSLASEVR
ncbi:MAG: zf-HC2 domain-containing protein [Planctomycetes bacterium]|nr:zf-HC2 domain-containing protein [Planctomycetota bacterium]